MDPIIRIENLSYAYRGYEDSPVLNNINLDIQQGEFFAIAGRTGSGKSTLCYAINGLAPHSFGGKMEGTVHVAGVNTLEATIPELSRKVGIVLQSAEAQIVGLTVEEDTEFGLENIALPVDEIKERARNALDLVGMLPFLESSPWNLSGGQKQRLAIAAALAFRPEVLVLDNPTAELDPVGKADVLETIARLNQEHNITIVIIDQELHEIIPFAGRIAILDKGAIAIIGTPEYVLDQADIVREIGVKLPDVTEVAYQLRKVGKWPGKLPITLEAGLDGMSKLLKASGELIIPTRPQKELGESLIEISDVEFSYSEGPKIIRGVDLTIRRGEFVAVMGQNGAGKTTLVKHFNGLLKPENGKVIISGMDSAEKTVAQLSTRVGYVFQNPDHQIFSKSVAEELAFGPENLGWSKDKIEQAVTNSLADLNMQDQGDAEPFFMGLAERKLIAIASVLIMEPEILVLDEPATGADYSIALQIMRYISKLHESGLTVIVITHDVSLVANYADRLIVLQDGKIALDGLPEEIFSQREALYDCRVSPPQVAELSQKLIADEKSVGIIRVPDMVDALKGK